MVDFLNTLANTLLAGLGVCALVFAVAAWRRLPSLLLAAAPWLVAAAVLEALIAVHVVGQYRAMLPLVESHASADEMASLRQFPGTLLCTLLVGFAGLIVGVVAGLDSLERRGLRGLPWTRRLTRKGDQVGPGPVRWLGETATILAFAVAWTALVYRLSDARLDASDIAGALRPGTVTALTVVTVPLLEELTYRLGVQGILIRVLRARWAVPVAILATALIWSLLHGEPLRIVQLLPIGVGLGWLQLRHGTESSIAAHVGFNASMLWLAPILWPA